MHSDDLATIDDEGYCSIVGRVRDMLIRGGENVYPHEIKEFLFRDPKVQSAQVFGVPDQKYGKEICAWIVLKPGYDCTEDDIREFCRNQIARYKVPRYIRFAEEMPMDRHGQGSEIRHARPHDRRAQLNETRTAEWSDINTCGGGIRIPCHNHTANVCNPSKAEEASKFRPNIEKPDYCFC